VHVVEEYAWPGGFLEAMRSTAPRFAPFVTPMAAAVTNGTMIGGLVVCAFIGTSVPLLGLSGAALVFVNGCVHLAATVRTRRYTPGVGSSLLLYIPLSVVAYVLFARAGYLSAGTLAASAGLGLLYQVVPLAYFLLRSLASHRTAKAASN